MKVGILTYHRAHNYGAVLQCYALKTYLEQLGHDVVVVDYCPKYFHYGLFVWYKWFSLHPVRFINKLRLQAKTFALQKRRHVAFTQFIDEFVRPKRLNLHGSETDIDCFIFGSDQIWRKNGDEFDPIFWGDFKAAHNAKLVSYAASMGKDSLSEDESEKIKSWLSHFHTIMVRETSLKELLSPFTRQEINVVVDPTLLLPAQDWDKIAVRPNRKKPYVLIYQVVAHPATLQLAREAAKHLGAEIVEIASTFNGRKADHEKIYDASPNDFVGYVADAAMVVTTSFHGTAFSIIYRRPFISIKQHKPSDLRIESILDSSNLLDRFIDCDCTNISPTLYYMPYPDLKAISASKQHLNTI